MLPTSSGAPPRRRPLILALQALLVVVCHGATGARGQEALFTYTPLPDENALSGFSVFVDTRALETDPASLTIDLPDGSAYVAVRDGADVRAPGDLAWRGRLLGHESSRVVLTLKDDLVTGRIFDGRRITLLEPGPHGHRLRFVEPSALPPEGRPLSPEFSAAAEPPSSLSVDPVDGIDLLVVYSPQARAGAGGTAQVESLIQAAVDNANTAFIDSGMDARFVLVHTEETTRSEDAGDLVSDLVWVRTDAGVGALRDSVRADMVALIVNGGDYCGRGYVMDNPGAGFEAWAFQVTRRSCAVGNLSFAHEHGHNMGFEHDPDNGPNPGGASYPWSFGHRYNAQYRTVMAYNCASNCSRVGHFSNPHVNHSGLPTGIDNERDNARTGDLTAPIVTDFRLRDSSAPDLIVINPGVSNTTPETGQSFTTSATVSNQGDAAADVTTLRYYRSANSTISTSDTQISTDAVASLAASASSSESDQHAIVDIGTWWVGACVDSVTGESNTSNNCSAGVQIEVVEAGCAEADELFLEDTTESTTVTFQACTSIHAGPAWVVSPAGNVTLRAGQQVVLRNGVSVEAGGLLKIHIAAPE